MKSIKRYADLGFGQGEHIKRLVKTKKEHQIIEGIEHPEAERIKVPGARLKYIGFEEWLKRTKPNTYTAINADLFLNNYFKKYATIKGEIAFAKPGTELKMIEELIKLKEKLLPNGRIYFTFPTELKSILSFIQEAGFTNIEIRQLTKKELNTSFRRYHSKKGNNPVLISARKPAESKRVFEVSPNEIELSRQFIVSHKGETKEQRKFIVKPGTIKIKKKN